MRPLARKLFALRWAKDWIYPIWNAASVKRLVAAMAFKTLKTKRAAVTLEALGAAVDRRREVVGEVEVPRNTGLRRTASKRALLKAIKDAGGKW